MMSLGFVISSEATTRGDIQIIEASENIRYLSQKIAKDYLFVYQNPAKKTLKNRVIKSTEQLDKEINTIIINTQSSESKDLLSFLTDTNREIKKLLTERVNQNTSQAIVDYSEIFVEAANYIEELHQYKFSNEEKMLMAFKDLDYLLERITKYYIASVMNINKLNNANQMKSAIVRIENILYDINSYAYPTKLLNERKEMNLYWKTYKEFIYKSDDYPIPNLLQTFVETFKKSMKNIELHHKKNQ